MTIRLLDNHVVSQIAAGEVVERPASVVKELIENSIDANASYIHVSTRDAGKRLVRVSDNGDGISSEDVELAFVRHATSKITSLDDLQRLISLGFRGEALASIASVSRLTVTTRHIEEEIGTQLLIESSNILKKQSIGAPIGTIISIENLFFNTPARLKFLKTDPTEKRHITGVTLNYAMMYPHIRFVLEHDNREVFRSTGSGELGDVIIKALGLDQFKNMMEIDFQQGSVEVVGYTSTPELVRSDRSKIILFVNGRAIQDSNLAYAITQAYQGFLKDKQYPVSVISITLPPDWVDVNVHPTKAEVRFQDHNMVFNVIQRAVRETLLQSSGAQFSSLVTRKENDFSWNRSQANVRGLETDYEPRLLNDDDRASGVLRDTFSIPVGAGMPDKPRTLPVLRVVGQIGAVYIVAEGPAGMYLIDQNAAHLRINYEQLKEEFEQRGYLESYEIEPQTKDTSSKLIAFMEKHKPILEAHGYRIEPFGTSTYVLRGVPIILADRSIEDILQYLTTTLLAKLNISRQELSEVLLLTTATLASIKSGQVLNHQEMQSIVKQLERCPNPLTSPDERRVFLHMSGEQIAQEFKKS